jgi:hypothetical protein
MVNFQKLCRIMLHPLGSPYTNISIERDIGKCNITLHPYIAVAKIEGKAKLHAARLGCQHVERRAATAISHSGNLGQRKRETKSVVKLLAAVGAQAAHVARGIAYARQGLKLELTVKLENMATVWNSIWKSR